MVTTFEDVTERPTITTPHHVTSDEVFKTVESLDLEKVKALVDKHLDNLNLYFSSHDAASISDEDLFDDQEYLAHDLFNIIDDEYNTPLHKAILMDVDTKEKDQIRYQIVEDIVVRGKARCDVVNNEGLTPLLVAVKKNKPKIVSLLIKAGKHCSVNDKCQVAPYIGYTALHSCCTWSLIEATKSEDPNEDTTVKTARDIESLARLLISLGADVNSKNSEGETPLHTCARNGTLGVARLLISEGADVNAINKHKVTPLMIAATLGNLAVVELLLDTDLQEEGNVGLKNNPVKVDLKDQMGDTALHFAFQSQLQRVFANGIEVSQDHERIAYLLVHTGKANMDIYSNDEYLATDFTSDNFKHILRTVSQHAHLFPSSLDALLQMPDEMLQSQYMDPKERIAFAKAVQEYKKDRQELEDAESKKGGCPMVTGNRQLMKKRAQMKSSTTSTTKTDNTTTTSKLPPGHPTQGGDISKCPFMKGKQANDSQDAQETKEITGEVSEKPKGKCPIPYHNELMMIFNSRNLVYLLVLVVCVVLLAFPTTTSLV
ncbi:hypothetical protein C9374_011338 [Naegleria lovaniensis]|uniref:Uncharacterized protein n=1 Tax=Naegleria lovaniensis TaxID=51637 RepID=A0AA88GX30_NAELO|nr:uncharacterized protein C9374_011338 [Naegleria lovaniensis]KAG2392613.1 hypothetical protein C9374_011338 [Naegleria lovaniensis]